MPHGIHALVQDAGDKNRLGGLLDPVENQMPPDGVNAHPVSGAPCLWVFGDRLQRPVKLALVLGKWPFSPSLQGVGQNIAQILLGGVAQDQPEAKGRHRGLAFCPRRPVGGRFVRSGRAIPAYRARRALLEGPARPLLAPL